MKVFQEKPKVLFTASIGDDGLTEVIRIGSSGVTFNPSGSCNVYANLNNTLIEKHLLSFDHQEAFKIDYNKLGNIDLIFNQISNPETHKRALAKMEKLVKQSNITCLNKPQNVLRTSRDSIYNLLQEIDGLTVPKTVKITPHSPGDIYDQLRASGFQFPVIFRKSGMHGGKNMTLLYSYDEVEKFYPFALDGSDYYLIQYIDYKEDNVYKKFRLAVVDGEAFIRHLIFSDQWLIHSSSREFMEKNSLYKEKEKSVLKSFDESLKPRIQPVIKKIHGVLGLDYFGIDCNIDANMNILAFEINANMNILINNQSQKDFIWEEKIILIKKALTNMILRKASSK